jgi:hypothetical protein
MCCQSCGFIAAVGARRPTLGRLGWVAVHVGSRVVRDTAPPSWSNFSSPVGYAFAAIKSPWRGERASGLFQPKAKSGFIGVQSVWAAWAPSIHCHACRLAGIGTLQRLYERA